MSPTMIKAMRLAAAADGYLPTTTHRNTISALRRKGHVVQKNGKWAMTEKAKQEFGKPPEIENIRIDCYFAVHED